MTIRYLSGTTIASTPGADGFTASASDTIIIEEGATVGASGVEVSGNFVYGIGGPVGIQFVDIFNFGTIFGTDAGVFLEGTGPMNLLVGEEGRILSEVRGVDMTAESVSIENLGLIRGVFCGILASATGNVSIRNEGTISNSVVDFSGGTIVIESGTANLVNTGTLANLGAGGTSFIQNGDLSASIWNAGMMVGDVYLGSGNDLYQGGGTVVGTVSGDYGDDTLIGGDRDDLLVDFFGSNWVAGGNGADDVGVAVLSSGQQTSHVFGGIIGGADSSADDTIVVASNGPGANIFLSTGAALGSVTRIGDNAVAAFITGFENAVGTEFADAIFGSSASNRIDGSNGGDWMVGNGGADRFVFSAEGQAVAGDQIRDFRRSEGDRIELLGIDANVLDVGNDAFVFRTTHTNNAAGEVVVTNYATSAVVNLYTNADNIIDGTFVVVFGEAGVTSLTAADFLL